MDVIYIQEKKLRHRWQSMINTMPKHPDQTIYEPRISS